jgi:hypothetical protein
MIMRLHSAFAVFLLLSTASSVFSQTRQRGWADVNFGAALSRAGSETFTFSDTVFEETMSLSATYPDPPTGAAFDFGGGVMVSRVLGVGVSFAGAGHRTDSAVTVTIPHPFFFNASGTATGTTERLTRAEGAAHLQAVVVPYAGNHVQVRFFGGPSYFRYRADMVQDVSFLQTASMSNRTNIVAVTGANVVEAEGTGWGFHIGGDVNYFFSRILGVGGFARFSAGNVSLDEEPLSEVNQKVSVGGLQLGGGLRVRF